MCVQARRSLQVVVVHRQSLLSSQTSEGRGGGSKMSGRGRDAEHLGGARPVGTSNPAPSPPLPRRADEAARGRASAPDEVVLPTCFPSHPRSLEGQAGVCTCYFFYLPARGSSLVWYDSFSHCYRAAQQGNAVVHGTTALMPQ